MIIDECHHLPAVSFERVLSEVKAQYVVGLTATPQRRDGHQPIIHMQIGPIRFRADPRSQLAERSFDHRLVVRETDFDATVQTSDITIQELYGLLVANDKRNEQIVDDVLMAMEEGRSPILLTERKEHLDQLHERLKGFVRHIVILRGGRSAKERREVEAQLASISMDEERLILATGRYIGEGFDDARLDTLFLALPVSWKGTLVQYAGRLNRVHPDKSEVRIMDYVDRKVPMLVGEPLSVSGTYFFCADRVHRNDNVKIIFSSPFAPSVRSVTIRFGHNACRSIKLQTNVQALVVMVAKYSCTR